MVEQPLRADYQDRRPTIGWKWIRRMFFFFFRRGDLTGFLLFRILDNGNSLEENYFSFFRVLFDWLLVEIQWIERFASHEQFRKSFSFMRFCNNWFTSPCAFVEIEFFCLLEIMHLKYLCIEKSVFTVFYIVVFIL